VGFHFLQDFFGNGVQDVCGDKAGRDGVDAYAFRAQLTAPGFGEAYDAELAGGVVGLAEVAVDTDDGAGVEDDAAALGHHGVGDGLRAVEDAAQVHVYDFVELLERHFLQARILGDAGVVDEDVDAAELVFDLADHGIDHGALGHVHHITDGLGAQGLALFDGFIDAGLLDVANDNGRAFFCKFEGGGQAYALGGAGNEADLVLESWHVRGLR